MWKLWPNLKKEESWEWQLRAAAWVFRFYDRVTDPKHTMEGRKAPIDRMAMVFASVIVSTQNTFIALHVSASVIPPMQGWKALVDRIVIVCALLIAAALSSKVPSLSPQHLMRH